MKANIKYILIDNIITFSNFKCEVQELIKLSIKDDAILGFDETFDQEKAIQYMYTIERCIKEKMLQILIGIHQDSVVACCFLKKNLMLTTKHICDLQKGYIHPEFRGKGILESILANISKECLKQGVDLLTLDVRTGSRAHQIWRQCGFETYGVLPDYSRHQGKKYDGHYMMQPSIKLWERFKNYY